MYSGREVCYYGAHRGTLEEVKIRKTKDNLKKSTRGRTAKSSTEASIQESTQDNAGRGQRKSTKTDATENKETGKSRGTLTFAKSAAGREVGSRRTATTDSVDSVEVRAAGKLIRSRKSPSLHSEVDNTSSEVEEEHTAMLTTRRRQGRERHKSTSGSEGEQNELYRADIVRYRTLNLGQQPHKRASTRLTDRLLLVDTSDNDVVNVSGRIPVGPVWGRSHMPSRAMPPRGSNAFGV